MANYILKRLGQTVLVLLLVSVFAYMLVYLMPGDPVYALYGADLTPEQYQIRYLELELDKPVYIRYLNWLKDALHGDFGTSIKYHTEVSELLASRIPVTLYLGLISLAVGVGIGVVLGMLSATRSGGLADNLITVFANLGSATPLFWLGVLGVYLFSIQLGWLPSFGFSYPWETDLLTSVKQCILPVIALSVGTLAAMARQTRSGMLEVIRLDYIRTARAKGCREKAVILTHAFPNALIPIVTLIGLQFRMLVAGTVTVEQIFNIPGMGQLLVNAVFNQDVALTQACILVTALVICLANLLVDISYGYIDPRIRIQ